jgi:putative membrane protein
MKQLAANECKWSGKQLRALNEAPTLLLVIIVMLAIFKNNLPTDITAWVIFGLVILMAASIQIYAKIRRRNQEKLLVQMNQINQNNPTDQIPQVQN